MAPLAAGSWWRWVVIAAAAGLVALVVYVGVVGLSRGSAVEIRPEVSEGGLGVLGSGGRLVVRSVDVGAPGREGGVYELTAAGGVGGRLMDCVRVHVSAAGPGLCLDATIDGSSYTAEVFDGDFEERRSFGIVGVPSRVRVSADGRFGAYTAFVGGRRGYVSNPDEFETDTRIVDLASGDDVLNLAGLVVTKDGRRLDADDRQLWGVTFGDRGRYYATMATGHHRYLIEGHVRSDRATAVADRVECPSLSPDRTRIAYKQPIGDGNRWRLHVLDLKTGARTALSERRSIDDQPEWVGNRHVAYSNGTATYTVPADGSGRPYLVAREAASPAYLPGPAG